MLLVSCVMSRVAHALPQHEIYAPFYAPSSAVMLQITCFQFSRSYAHFYAPPSAIMLNICLSAIVNLRTYRSQCYNTQSLYNWGEKGGGDQMLFKTSEFSLLLLAYWLRMCACVNTSATWTTSHGTSGGPEGVEPHWG